jgi:hypothetical protein
MLTSPVDGSYADHDIMDTPDVNFSAVLVTTPPKAAQPRPSASAVDPGSVVDRVHDSPPFQPQSPDQPP